MKNSVLAVLASLVVVLLSSCGSSGTTPTPSTTYTVGGTLSGLISGLTITLQNNSGDDLPLTANGSFTFTTKLEDAAAYSVAVSTQPTGQTCTVTNGSGTVSSADVSNITVACVYTNKVIFITNTTTTGNIGSIAAADAICMADANKPDAGTYKAFIVDGTNRVACTNAACYPTAGTPVDWVLAASTTYYRSDGTTAIGTTTDQGVFNVTGGPFELTNSFSSTSYNIWTGMQITWMAGLISNCTNFTSADAAVNGLYGNTAAKDNTSVATGAQACNLTANLACVAQ